MPFFIFDMRQLVRLAVALAVAIIAVLAWWSHAPGLPAGFVLDDYPHLVRNEFIQIEVLSLNSLLGAASSFSASPMGRPVAMLSFAIEHLWHGLDPAAYRATNLVIHLLAGMVLFLFARSVARGLGASTDRARLAALITAALWTLHPINATPVLYLIQRMTALAGLGGLACLWLYLAGRLRALDGRRAWPWFAGAASAALLAVGAKENALVLPLLVLLLEIYILRFRVRSDRDRRLLWLFVIGGVLIPAALAIGYLAAVPGFFLDGYAARPFGFTERLLTEARVLWLYLKMLMLPQLADFGLYHDDIAVSTGLLSPPTTLLAVLGIAALGTAAVVLRRRIPVLGLGIAFFLVGHSMESSVFALEIAFEHRNYLPAVGVLLAVGWFASAALPSSLTNRLAVGFGIVAMLAMLATQTHWRATAWPVPFYRWQLELESHPDSARANLEMGRLQVLSHAVTTDAETRRSQYGSASMFLERAWRLDPSRPDPLVIHWLLDLNAGLEPRPEHVRTGLEHLAQGHVRSSTASMLADVLLLEAEGSVRIPDRLFDRLHDAITGLRRIDRRAHSNLISALALATYQRRDLAVAAELARSARDRYPQDPTHWFNLAELLLEIGRCEQAEEVLSRFEGRREAAWTGERIAEKRAAIAERCR